MNGRPWTPEEVAKLWAYAGTMGLEQAARRIGRSWSAVASKARTLGINWSQGRVSVVEIARRAGCAQATVTRLISILWPDGERADRTRRSQRYPLSPEDADRLVRILAANHRRRHRNVKAGRISTFKRRKGRTMRRRIQHPRNQAASRIQIERLGTGFAVRVDRRPLRVRATGTAASFETREEAQAEALWCLACNYLDWPAWRALERWQTAGERPPDLVLIDLLELGLVSDNFELTIAGATVGHLLFERIKTWPRGTTKGTPCEKGTSEGTRSTYSSESEKDCLTA